MAWWSEQVVPRATHVLLANPAVASRRREVMAGVAGNVVEIGFGSGPTLATYPADVRVLAVEPSPVARRLAASRIAGCGAAVEFVGADAERIPLETGSADAAVSVFTLCTVPDAARALRELRRVLRPGGRLHFLEHGLSPDPGVARWQRWLTPIQRRLGAGCHLDRPIAELVRSAGFEPVWVRASRLGGPRALRPWDSLTLGVATARPEPASQPGEGSP